MYILCTWGLRRSSSIKASPKVSSLGSRTPLLAAWMPGSLSVKVDASQSPAEKKKSHWKCHFPKFHPTFSVYLMIKSLNAT